MPDGADDSVALLTFTPMLDLPIILASRLSYGVHNLTISQSRADPPNPNLISTPNATRKRDELRPPSCMLGMCHSPPGTSFPPNSLPAECTMSVPFTGSGLRFARALCPA